jgi:hypothetical protein
MNPTQRDLHVNRPLTTISVGYKNDIYVADDLFLPVNVMKRSDIVPKYTKSDWFRNKAEVRAPGTKSRGSGFRVETTDTYWCPRYSFRFEIDDDTRGNQDQPFNLDRDGAEFVTDKMLLNREVNWSTGFFKTGIWETETTLSGTSQWSDYGNSSPLVDIEGDKDTVEGLIAREPNFAVMGRQVWTQLKWHPDLIDLVKYTRVGQMSVDLFASLAELASVKVGRAIYTTTADGTDETSVSYSRIWGKNFLMLHKPARPGLMTPAAGYTFIWNRVAGARQYIKRMRDEEKEIDIIEGNSYFVQKVTASDAGAIHLNAVA